MRHPYADPDSPAKALWAVLKQASFWEACAIYAEFWDDPLTTDFDRAELSILDRFFLGVYICGREDLLDPWLYARCREVELDRDERLDLWARFHYKSTLITFLGSIQELLEDPEITIGIFSDTGALAKSFSKQIKEELESNTLLKRLHPDVLFANTKDSPLWTEKGFAVKRKSNPKEATVSGWGLTDSYPVGFHFRLRLYDDLISINGVTSPEMIAKVTERWELSLSLGAGEQGNRSQYAGTRYRFGDSYEEIMKRSAAKPRIFTATHDGELTGKPVFMKQDAWEKLLRESSLNTIACQQLLDPRKGGDTSFKIEWIRAYEIRPMTLNVYIAVDPARSKKKTSDKTAIMVVGIDYAMNRYLLDGMLHRMSLSERWTNMDHMRTKWRRQPGVQLVKVGYEKYGAESDMDYFEEQQQREKRRYKIHELTWTADGKDSHADRVQRLEPHFRNGRFFFPYQGGETSLQRDTAASGQGNLLAKPILQKDENDKLYNLTEILIKEEYIFVPAKHVDGLDALSRIDDLDIRAPKIVSRPPRQKLAVN